jgi:isopenicillin-N N-acyltransferase-like protein
VRVRVPIVVVGGGPRERGLAVGRALAQPIARSLGFYRRALARRGLAPEDLPRALGPYREAWASLHPAVLEELDATAGGAGVDPWELFAVNAFEEVDAFVAPAATRTERCTSFATTGPDGTVLAHAEQWSAGDRGNVAVVVERPDDGAPAFASPTVVTCLPAVGLNADGVAQGVMSLSAHDERVGVPRIVASRLGLGVTGRGDAVAAVAGPGRAGGYAHLFATAEAPPFVVETTAERHAVLNDVAGHTNHYLDPGLAEADADPAPGSLTRLDRLRGLLAERRPRTPQDAMEVLRDHANRPDAICRHGAEGDEEDDEVLFAMVCHVEGRRMWVAGGTPCDHPFEEVDLSEAFA